MIRVGVVRGGPSSEHDVSLKTGEAVLKHMPKDRYHAFDIIITRDGTLLFRGHPLSPQELPHHVDVIWNALHGEFGEDGKFQQILEELGIPYTGSEPLPSAIGMHKVRTKEYAQSLGMLTAPDVHIERHEGDDAELDEYADGLTKYIHNQFPGPWVIKPLSGGSSVGTSITRSLFDLRYELRKLIGITDVLVEQQIFGREATVGVLEGYRGKKLYPFLPIEIQVPKERFFDFDMKYSGKAKEISPGHFPEAEKRELQRLAQAIHDAVGLRHYSRSDFIVSPKGIYFLEVNTLPGLTEESLVPKAIKTVGGTLSEFIDHVLQLAMKKR